ncbi:5-oxoprolinase subunit PxpB [Spongiibacter sp. KMU-158]|uniref:5-oxoprolinase subunit PxpB n=1 Tax=Spongiibacter pelagi TaxID=2760804 RepID=A0A927C5A7_9GAMM|nr:5-oxoprolinase subunit PxpB [Spongiibacter pelagi]MBD2859841.1 5-oxoprolinase subunit PxpB [Spongiibacter pelagi]
MLGIEKVSVEVLSEQTGIIYFGNAISSEISNQVLKADQVLSTLFGEALIDTIPAYCSLHFTLNPLRLNILSACALLREKLPELLAQQDSKSDSQLSRTHIIPVFYHPDVGPDLNDVSVQAGLSIEQIIALHTANVYRVYAIGFAPGFCFLGSLDPQLQLPRRDTPRTKVPAGSVAIAAEQTAVYPCETPGGWHLLGRTAVDMLARCQDQNDGIRVGDTIQFSAITRNEFLKQGGDDCPLV